MLGIATACLSTALGSMFGSARIMQALARDQIFPPLRIFSKGSAHGDEPRRALVLTYLLAQCGLLVGGIDAVAPILTNFFLVTYTLTNAAAALLELSGVPNFRPHWRVYHWGLSLAGAALTLGAMFFLNYVFALITIAFPFGRNTTLAIFSQVIGPANQGFWMGLCFTAGAIPRCFGPSWSRRTRTCRARSRATR